MAEEEDEEECLLNVTICIEKMNKIEEKPGK